MSRTPKAASTPTEGLDKSGALRELNTLLSLPEEELAERCLEKRRAALHAALQAPAYRALYAPLLASLPEEEWLDVALARWEELPPLEKDLLREEREQLRTPYQAEAILDGTGGSTGAPIKFYRSESHRAYSSAVDSLTMGWLGGGEGTRSVVLWGAPLDAKRLHKSFLQRLLFWLRGGNWVLDCFVMSRARCDEARRLIERAKPPVIRGYRSVLLEFCRYLEETGPLRHRPKAIVSGAELVLPQHRERIESVLKAPLFDRYGSRESGLSAAECQARRLHVLTPSVYLEVESEAGINVPGEEGSLLVTTLNNAAQPLIRYRIGDSARWIGPTDCSCGRRLPVIEMTQGREAKLLDVGGGEQAYIVFFHHNIRDYAGILESQLIQHSPGVITFALSPADCMSEAERVELEGLFRERLGPNCVLKVELRDQLERNRTGKVEQVIFRERVASTRGP